LNITTTDAGLLTTTGAVSTDRTADVLVQLAQLAGEILKMGVVAGRGAGPGEGPPKPKELKPFTFDAVFDPADEDDYRTVNQQLAVLDRPIYQIGINPKPTAASTANAKGPATYGRSADGLVYRRPVPYVISIQLSDGTPVKAVQTNLPNGGQIGIVPFDAGMFVTTTYDVGFADGMLTKLNQTRPSETLGFVTMLTNVAKEVVSIPTSLLQFKVDYSTKEQALVESQKAKLEAQKDVIQLRKDIAALKKDQP
jgi:hypothetical protein